MKWKQLELFPRWSAGNKYRERPTNKHGFGYWFRDSKPTKEALKVYKFRVEQGIQVGLIAKDYGVCATTICWVVRQVKEFYAKTPTLGRRTFSMGKPI